MKMKKRIRKWIDLQSKKKKLNKKKQPKDILFKKRER